MEPTPPERPTAGPTPTPYRDGVRLAEIIPPDHRRLKAVGLVVASMVAGVALWTLGGWGLEALRADRELPVVRPVTPIGYVPGRIANTVLHGPGGSDVLMPPARRSVVHVWLQGCADCMPAFEAMARLPGQGGFGFGGDVPVINVAFGEAELTWAQRYGVATNLVFDPGGVTVVRPLGISTFTTLVVEPSGAIIHRDRPDRPGYAERVRNAVLFGDAMTTPPTSTGDPFTILDGRKPFDQASVERVVAAHRNGIKRTCWEHGEANGPGSASATVTLEIDPDGHVVKTSANGDDPALSRCLEAQTRTWLFPAPGTSSTVNIPFKFVRQ